MLWLLLLLKGNQDSLQFKKASVASYRTTSKPAQPTRSWPQLINLSRHNISLVGGQLTPVSIPHGFVRLPKEDLDRLGCWTLPRRVSGLRKRKKSHKRKSPQLSVVKRATRFI